MINFKISVAGLVILTLTSCGYSDNPPLIFGQTQTIGLTVAGAATDAGGEITLGFRDRNIAIVPVTKSENDGNQKEYIGDTITETVTIEDRNQNITQTNQNITEGSFSVISQFSLDADADAQAAAANVGLGKFFATGLAARTLADGFRCALSRGTHEACTGKSASEWEMPQRASNGQ